MIKNFELVVDEDVIPFFSFDCNEDGTAKLPYLQEQIYAFENNPRVIDVTSLNYLPRKMSVYDEDSNTFTTPGYSDNGKISGFMESCFRFVYLIENTVYSNSVIRKNDKGQSSMLIAALQSNPVIRPVRTY
jgi:hypothetical protein